jgi:predicted HNH restriction endonuclease
MSTKNKELQKKYRDAWYQANKKKQMVRQYTRKKELLNLLKRYKSFLNCTDCGMSFRGKEECLDFHHLIPSEKENTIGRMATYSKESLKKELSKCIPLCANCHRTRHKDRR